MGVALALLALQRNGRFKTTDAQQLLHKKYFFGGSYKRDNKTIGTQDFGI